MNKQRPSLARSAQLYIVGLLAAASGILILFFTGWVSQSMPTGTILLASAAALVAVVRWRWTLVVTMLLTLFIFVMGFIAPGLLFRLTHPEHLGGFIGTWVQELGLVLALAAGSMAMMGNRSGSR